LRTAFSALKTAPRTATLPDLFDAANRILRERMDRLVTRFRKTEAEFTAGYSAARQILNRGGRTSEPATPTPAPAPAPVPA
jgi:4'-phosphopantetheinyl transferase EntD